MKNNLRFLFVIAMVAMMNVVSVFGQDSIPQLEAQNFRVNSDGWITKKAKGLKHYNDENHFDKTDTIPITIKISPDDEIVEYIDGVPDELIGVQLFSYYAAIRETERVNKKIPTFKDIKNIINITYQGDYQKFLKEEHITTTCRGTFQPDEREFVYREFYYNNQRIVSFGLKCMQSNVDSSDYMSSIIIGGSDDMGLMITMCESGCDKVLNTIVRCLKTKD